MMADNVGFHEIIPHLTSSSTFKSVNINTGASQSTLQDIKVPDYGGGYVYQGTSSVTHNRYIFWRVSDATVELWEESLDRDLTHNRVLLRIVGLPVLEGISVHERDGKHVILLVATIASTHCFTLPHPDTLQQAGDGISCSSIFNELEQHNLREVHSMHLMATPAVEGGRAPPTSSGLVGSSAVFLFGQPSAALLLLCMDTAPSTAPVITAGVPGSSGVSSSSTAAVTLIKNTSLVNRLFMGFVPGMFRGGEGSDTINSLCCVALSSTAAPGTKMSTSASSSSQVYGVGVCGDGRLRLWCLRRKECVLIRDTLEDTAEAATRHTPHGQRHVLSCRTCGDGSFAVVAVLLSFVEKQLLLLYKVTAAAGGGGTATAGATAPPPPPTLTHIKTLYPPQHHLVDMDLTPTHVWTLWTDANNENQLLYSSIDGGPSLGSAILQPPPDKSVPHADTSLDPRELCLQELFAPYQFAPHTIAKALSIYRGGASSRNENNPTGLREEVEAVLQGQLDAKVSQHTTSPEQLYDLTLDTWQNFYSHALQYHQVGMKGLGVVCGGGGGAVALVRRKAVSWLAKADGLEAMVAAALVASPAQDLTQVVVRCGSASVLCGDSAVAASVAGVLRCVAVVRGLMDADVAAAFLLDMAHHSHPEAVAEDVAASLLGQVIGGDEVASIVSNAVCSVPNFPGGLRLVVRALNLDCSAAASSSNIAQASGADGPRCQLWCALVAGSLHQLASSRLLMCRDLLVLQQLALQLAQLCHLSPDSVGQLRASLLQDTVLVSRAYHALLCLARAPATRPTAHHLHATRRLVAALGLQDSTTLLPPLPQGTLPATALQAVLQQGACPELGAGRAKGESMKQVPGVWVTAALEAVRAITRLAWPLQDRGGSTALLEALVFSGQGEAALQYIRQVCGWCEWSLYSRHFLLGVCLLLQGQHRKAARLLQEAGEGCATEQLLSDRVGGGGEGADSETGGRVHYTLRLVRLFEVFGQPALALRLAASSLCLAQHSPHHLAQLYAVLFKHHLALGHHDEAFTALLANPDPGPQRACLRQLLVALYQRGCLRTLVNYQYGNLTSEVVTILENRARSADILVNNYYHLLYAFHVHKQNYKKAASVMYECAWRLSAEGVGEEGLKQQLKCYLACINCLKLLPKDAAWILKPNPVLPSGDRGDDSRGRDTESRGGKRCSAGERIPRSSSKSRRRGGASAAVQVLELHHINKEYQLVHALLTLAAASPGTHCSAGLTNDASSTIALLCHGRLYREASRLCRLFEVSEVPVVQSLAAACVVADVSTDRQQHAAWLKHNGVSNTTSGWWDLLREFVCAEPGKRSGLHYNVTTCLLDRGHQLPPWLLDSYTRRDPGSLLRVLLLYGRLEDAGQLALRLLDAVTAGINADQFGLTGAVHSSGDSVWLPYTALDHLLLELRENKHHQYYDKVLTILEGKLGRYQSEVARVSRDAVLLAHR